MFDKIFCAAVLQSKNWYKENSIIYEKTAFLNLL